MLVEVIWCESLSFPSVPNIVGDGDNPAPLWCASTPLSKSRHCAPPRNSNQSNATNFGLFYLHALHTLFCGLPHKWSCQIFVKSTFVSQSSFHKWKALSVTIQLKTIKSFLFYPFIVQQTYSLDCISPFKWTTYVVHELVKRGLEGHRLMELLSGWEKVSQATPL